MQVQLYNNVYLYHMLLMLQGTYILLVTTLLSYHISVYSYTQRYLSFNNTPMHS